jgi:hypothetical protein
LSLLFYAALAVGYWFWLSTVFMPPTSYWGAALVAFIVLCSIGAIINAKNAWRDWSLVLAGQRGLPPSDGKLLAVCGEIHPVSKPLIAPFSGEECVICEYDLSRHRQLSNASNGETAGSDFAGFLMVPSIIRSKAGDVKLLGYPILDGFPDLSHNSCEAARRAIDYLTTREFEERTGLKMVTVLGVFDELWADEDGFVEKNIRLGKVTLPDLFPPELEAAIDAQLAADAANAEADKGNPEPLTEESDDEDDDNEDLDDDMDWDDEELAARPPKVPKMSEKRVPCGQEVCVIGRYDAMRGGLVPARGSTTPNRMIRGNAQKIINRSRSSVSSHLIGGLIALVAVHAATYGVMQAYKHSPEMKRHWEQEGAAAVQQGDIPRLEKAVLQGMSVDQRNGSGATLLMQATDPAVAAWLIERGADVNATDSDGETPLMHAVQSGSDDIVRQLIEAQANLDARSTNYDRTALMDAVDRGHDNIAAMLRKAGARDDVITAETGEALPQDGGEPLAVVQAYLDAIRAHDHAALKSMFYPESTYDFAGVDWELWHHTRPVKIESWTGFVRGDDATFTARGASGRGIPVTWVYQLQHDGERWIIMRERED